MLLVSLISLLTLAALILILVLRCRDAAVADAVDDVSSRLIFPLVSVSATTATAFIRTIDTVSYPIGGV